MRHQKHDRRYESPREKRRKRSRHGYFDDDKKPSISSHENSTRDKRDSDGDEYYSRHVKEEPVTPDNEELHSQTRERRDNERKRMKRKQEQDWKDAFDRKSEKFAWGKEEIKAEPEKAEEKEKPNFEVSGKLAADTNTFNGVVVKYNEPPEARKPKIRWRLYPFKGDDALPVLYIHRQSAYLIGRDRRVADIPVDHPSCSKQHAALQYRVGQYERDDGSLGRRIKPYLIDLGSANGTFLNNQKIDTQRYVELQEKDVVKFGFSSREYVLLHEHSSEGSGNESNTEQRDD